MTPRFLDCQQTKINKYFNLQFSRREKQHTLVDMYSLLPFQMSKETDMHMKKGLESEITISTNKTGTKSVPHFLPDTSL